MPKATKSKQASSTTRKITIGDFVKVLNHNDDCSICFDSAFKANLDWIDLNNPRMEVVRGYDDKRFSTTNLYIASEFIDMFTREGIKNRYCKIYSLKPVDLTESSVGWIHISFLDLVVAGS